jgi:hypothetical protein
MSGRTFLEDEEGGRYEQRENKPEEAPDLPSEGFALAMRDGPAICEKTSPGSAGRRLPGPFLHLD